MQTKIVYTLISSPNDIYLEQLWLSVYSLKLYNKNANIIILTDKLTYEYMNTIKEFMKIVDDVKVISIPNNYSNIQKSRYLKTTVRQNIEGRFLFIDTDTIITNNIEEIDNINIQIACVPDIHTTFEKFPFREGVIDIVKRIFNEDISDSQYYFNSGVMLVEDNKLTHEFYESWHNNWKYSSFSKGVNTDQQSLIKTDKDYNYLIEPILGIYNCQLLGSIQYFYDAKIIHFFNATWLPDTQYNPFFGKEIYLLLKKEQKVTSILDDKVRKCKSLFSSPSMIVADKFFNFILSSESHALYNLYNKNYLCFKVIGFIVRVINKFLKLIH